MHRTYVIDIYIYIERERETGSKPQSDGYLAFLWQVLYIYILAI